MDYSIKQGDLYPPFEPQLQNADGTPIVLTAALGVRAIMRIDGSTVLDRAALVTNATLGKVRIDWQAGETDTSGLGELEFEIDWGSSGPQTVPDDGCFYIPITPDLDAGERTLVSLGEFKLALGSDPNDASNLDDAYISALRQATAAIANYTGRSFGSQSVTEQRTYQYDGSGFLDIDDASAITAVTYTVGGTDYTLDATLWRAEPYAKPVLTHIVLPCYLGGPSPEMGFGRNYDVAYREGRLNYLASLVKVDGTWGWPKVPDDVKRAAIWTAVGLHENPTPYISESIEGYSRTIGPAPGQALPNRAKDLLAPYVRINI